MQEIVLEDQLRAQLHIQDPPPALLVQQAQHQQNRQNRPRRVKKPQPKSEATIEETINSLKNEIEYMPMKTPISILQELLSRRGKLLYFSEKIIDFSWNFFKIFSNLSILISSFSANFLLDFLPYFIICLTFLNYL